ncbi:spore coat putative kinase YutH [Bacillus piscicola]|uniref:spore coat putative kinase YutH n=1 Tax=Bacillus piscicola TaxID=1632684 RepID=UPI001F08EC71
MSKRKIYDHYGLYVEQFFQAGRYLGFYTKDHIFLLVPDQSASQDDWETKWNWAQQLMRLGDKSTALYIPPLSGQRAVPIDGENQLLFQVPHMFAQKRLEDGEELQAFHQLSTRLFTETTSHFFTDRWCDWWGKRIDQLENWFWNVRKKTTYTRVDRFFLQTFPYYIGRAENAIQYVKETASLMPSFAKGSLCHFCYTPFSWVTVGEGINPVKLPVDWLYDHPARDIAEWVRYAFEEEYDHQQISTFIDQYTKTSRLSRLDRQLIFGRLLFPYYYIEQLERLYLQETIPERETAERELRRLWDREAAHLDQLAQFLKTEVSRWETEPKWLLQQKNFA